jgi:hypothetical protein
MVETCSHIFIKYGIFCTTITYVHGVNKLFVCCFGNRTLLHVRLTEVIFSLYTKFEEYYYGYTIVY